MNQQSLFKKVGNNVRRRRLGLNLTRTGLGEKTGLGGRRIGFVERAAADPALTTLLKISRALNCTLEDLLQ